MDYVGMIVGFGTGALAIGAMLYTYAKSQNVISQATALELETVKSAYSDLQSDIHGAVGQISLTEIADILGRARELAVDGFTAAEAQELGVKIVDAMKK